MNAKRSLCGVMAIFGALALASCGHTNNLKNYQIEQRPIEYRTRIGGDAMHANTNLGSTGNPLADIVSGIGSAAMNGEVAQKLNRSARPEIMLSTISSAMQEAMNTYLRPTIAKGVDPDYIVESTLEEYKLECSNAGIRVHAEAKTRMIERQTGRIVWDDCESKTVPLTRNVAGALAPAPVGVIVGAITCSELLDMPEEDIRKALDNAAKEVAYQLTETLREDVAEMHSK